MDHAWQSMYPPLQAHASGWLPVSGGHRIYWEECGNPLGLPALFVHSGPGAGCRPDDRRWFDPQRYRIVLFDQRGTGRSLPLGRTRRNRTADLVGDMERLRQHLDIDRWLLLGGSWGATLALAYAQRHPHHVSALVLRAVFAATAREWRWLYGSGKQALAAFAKQLRDGRATRREEAASAWLQWEQDLDGAGERPVCALGDRDMAMARVGLHYARHGFWLRDDRLLSRADRLAGMPGVILQGTRDRITPGFAAAQLHQAWSGSELRLLPGTGHASSEPAMARALVEATDGFAQGR